MKTFFTTGFITVLVMKYGSSSQEFMSDACHGKKYRHTSNILTCPRNFSICISAIVYYQWHIDSRCPHTVGPVFNPSCCRRNTTRCAWRDNSDNLTEFEQQCNKHRDNEGQCELHSKRPSSTQPPCSADNRRTSTVSSVRSIHYSCIKGTCNQPATPTLFVTKVTGVTPRARRTSVYTESPDLGVTGIINIRNLTHVRQTLRPFGEVTSRMIEEDSDQTDVGTIIGGTFGGLLVCAVFVAVFIIRRRMNKEGAVSLSEVVRSSERPRATHIQQHPDLEVMDSSSSFQSADSFVSTDESVIQNSGTEDKENLSSSIIYSHVQKNKTAFVLVNTRNYGATVRTGGEYDHVHGQRPSLATFRYNDYDHITTNGADETSPNKKNEEGSGNRVIQPSSKTLYDNLSRFRSEPLKTETPNTSQYDVLHRNWKK